MADPEQLSDSEAPADFDPIADRLDSWKEIAAHLGRTVRTVQRWEKGEGLPVHRLHHEGGASVYAYPHELDEWFARRSDQDATDDLPATTSGVAPATASSDRARAGSGGFPRVGLVVLALGVLLVGWWLLGDPSPVPPPTAGPASLLTTHPGIERSPDLSPDGRQVVYVGQDSDGEFDLYLRQVGAARSATQLTDDARIEESPSWSRDGQSIAFLRHSGAGRRELVVIPALGGVERRILDFEVILPMDVSRSSRVSFTWSADGSWMAVTEKGEGPETMKLVVVDTESGERRPLTDPAPGTMDLAPALSPDGARLAFARSATTLQGTLHVLEVDPATGAPRSGSLRALPEAAAWNTEPEWTPDGEDLVFSGGRWPRIALWRIDADGSGTPRPLVGLGQGGAEPTLARSPGRDDSWRLVYAVADLDNDIWRVALSEQEADEEARPRPEERLISSSQRERFPSYSKDGDRIAFLSDRSGHREVWVADAEGRSPRQWTDWQSAYIWRPSWSPDGERLAYSVEIDGVMRAHVQGAPLSTPRALTEDGANDDDLAWSRDGRVLYVSSSDRGGLEAGVWAVDLDGGQPRLLAPGSGRPLGEDPSRAFLYVAMPTPEGEDLARFRIDGTGEGTVEIEPIALDSGPRTESLVMGPQGIFFVAEIEGGWRLRRWAFDDSAVTTVALLEEKPEPGIATSPDGRWALISRVGLLRSDLLVADGIR